MNYEINVGDTPFYWAVVSGDPNRTCQILTISERGEVGPKRADVDYVLRRRVYWPTLRGFKSGNGRLFMIWEVFDDDAED